MMVICTVTVTSKARMYSATLGRFMQTDPIGYGDGLNWYAYVGNDPVNKVDPSGLLEITVIGEKYTHFLGDAPAIASSQGFLAGLAESIGRNVAADVANATKPQKATLDKSCDGVAALRDPSVQQRALELPGLQARQGREFGFFSGAGGLLRLGQRYNGPNFSSPGTTDNRTIRAADVNANNFGDGYTHYAADVFIHSHRFSGVSGKTGDGGVARDLGITVAAIQPNGVITCTRGAAK